MFDIFLLPEAWVSLLTLTALEIVLGIDNIIFIAILASRLPLEKQELGRKLGLAGALISRLGLLGVISLIVQLKEPLFTVLDIEFSGKSLILLAGGLFLLYKATKEIHHKLEGVQEDHNSTKAKGTLAAVVLQIMVLDIVFSIDSVITAVGLTPHIVIMVIANLIAIGVMLASSGFISDFVNKHPSVKVLALSFLLMIGLVLLAEGLSFHIPKGYVYSAMGFSVFVEFINLRAASRKKASAP